MSVLDDFLNHLESRLNIHIVQQILRESDLISARSWSELKMLIKSGAQKDPGLLDKLKSALTMQQLCDLKAVSFFELDPKKASLLIAKLKSASVPSSALSISFPLGVKEDELKKDNGQLKVVAKFSDDFGSGIVLSRRREFTVNNEIYQSSFSAEVKKQFPDADKIIEVKVYSRQTFDVLYVNEAQNVLEVRADITREDGQPQTAGQVQKSIGDLHAYAHSFVSQTIPGYSLSAPLNLLPLAKKVYEDMSGAIKKIGFSTEEESVKRETMKAGVDLRRELFHKSGAAAIQHRMAIFEVAIQWHGSDVTGGVPGSRPEIHIPGSHREYTKLGARTDYLFTKAVRTYADSNFILTKIMSYK